MDCSKLAPADARLVDMSLETVDEGVDRMPIDVFQRAVAGGAFTSDDGFGRYVRVYDGTAHVLDGVVDLSDVRHATATHVDWHGK